LPVPKRTLREVPGGRHEVQEWSAHDTQLLVVAALGIALIVVLIAKLKLHPFLALVLGSAFVGLASGVELGKVITNFEDGVGGVLKEVGLLIALGAMLGKLLADSGGANRWWTPCWRKPAETSWCG
jgi:GntP family gluconate:H+ symporter